ncbi:MAG: hypothetical protein GYA21_08860 [Myxococcales bacterium]|nr:hypothetical protein [Myxococcales bacterium]
MWGALALSALTLANITGCGAADGGVPERVARFPEALPFTVARASPGQIDPPTAAEVDAFSRRLVRFFAATEFFRWTRRHSHGLAEDNPWGEPPYLFWWQDTTAVRAGSLVTFRHAGGADNMMAHTGRIFGPVVGAHLARISPGEQEALRELVLGYIRGVSATMDGSIWAEEDPVVPTIMARAIFHRNHTWELDGGRRAAVDYEPERREEFEQRHDTLHNPANPTWGDIYVRNKRSKDDFPWIYRMQAHLSRILHGHPDRAMHEAALRLYDQLTAFAADIVEHGYLIRAKGPHGQVFIPMLEGTDTVDDFASLVSYEPWVPNAECNAKLGVALIATGMNLGNDCGDGISETYEEVAMARYYGHTWMQWNFHVSAVVMALLFGDPTAQELLSGLGKRMDALRVRDDEISADPRYRSDVAQLLVLGAAYGLPLTSDEARQVVDEYAAAADHYQAFARWDLWSPALADGEYDYFPARESDLGGGQTRTHIWIPEMANLFEYCASPVRATSGAPFINCDIFNDPAEWEAAAH